jgi:hypothetical protein
LRPRWNWAGQVGKEEEPYCPSSAKEATVRSPLLSLTADACHDGGTMHCDSCKAKVTIKHTGPAGKGTDKAEVTYVNAEGKDCIEKSRLTSRGSVPANKHKPRFFPPDPEAKEPESGAGSARDEGGGRGGR